MRQRDLRIEAVAVEANPAKPRPHTYIAEVRLSGNPVWRGEDEHKDAGNALREAEEQVRQSLASLIGAELLEATLEELTETS